MDYHKYDQAHAPSANAMAANAGASAPASLLSAGNPPEGPAPHEAKRRRGPNVFGPLKKKYCFYFYILEVFGFVLFLSILVFIVYSLATSKKDVSYLSLVLTSLVYFVFYFQNRLLYNMCLHSNLGG